MASQYRTKDGETLDLICWRHYGVQSGAVEAVLEANTHLADQGVILQAGTLINLPDLQPITNDETIKPWD